MIIFTVAVLSAVSAVLALDTIGSLLSKRLGFFYGWISPISFILYAFAGALASRAGAPVLAVSMVLGALAGLIVGLTDSTLGWWISWHIGPGRLRPERNTTPVIATTIARVAMMAAAFGMVGAVLFMVARPL